MFDKLPEKTNVEESPLLPAQHTENDFIGAINHIKTNEQVYMAYGAIHPGQIEPSEYLRIWQSYIDDGQYIRPDVLVASVFYIVDCIILDVMEDPDGAIENYWGGYRKLDERIDELSKRLRKS